MSWSFGRAERRHAKLLDFGIARLTGADADATSTVAGDVIGTPAYMSPEQAAGKPLDARSDVFSFGAVLYELLAGTRAFTGDSTAQVLSAVLRDDPGPFDAPTALRQIVTRCLAKDPARRFQTMADVKHALQHLPRGSADVAASIAVLPFANLSADRENEYFGDGLAEEIINALAQVEGLKVIARTSAFSFKGKNEDVRSIAQALGVTNVLEGSVRRAGDRIRVTAQLIAAADGTHLWSERFDRPMTDVFAMQDEIASAITTALKGRLGGALASPRHYTPRLPAYETFLRGRAHLTQFTPDAWNRAKGLFEQAIALDAAYADPHAELALGYFICGMHGMRPMREVAPFVRAEVDQALALNPADQRPRFLLGAIALAHDYDWKAAEAHFAASMSATDVSGHARWIYASLYLRGLGRFEESAAEMGRAVQQDPLNATWHAIWGAHLFDAKRFDQAIDEALRATELEPNYFIAQHLLGEAYWASGKWNEAIAAFERAYQLAPWTITARVARRRPLAARREGACQATHHGDGRFAEAPLGPGGLPPADVGSRRCGRLVPTHDRTSRSVCPCLRADVDCRTLARASPLARTRGAHETASFRNMNGCLGALQDRRSQAAFRSSGAPHRFRSANETGGGNTARDENRTDDPHRSRVLAEKRRADERAEHDADLAGGADVGGWRSLLHHVQDDRVHRHRRYAGDDGPDAAGAPFGTQARPAAAEQHSRREIGERKRHHNVGVEKRRHALDASLIDGGVERDAQTGEERPSRRGLHERGAQPRSTVLTCHVDHAESGDNEGDPERAASARPLVQQQRGPHTQKQRRHAARQRVHDGQVTAAIRARDREVVDRLEQRTHREQPPHDARDALPHHDRHRDEGHTGPQPHPPQERRAVARALQPDVLDDVQARRGQYEAERQRRHVPSLDALTPAIGGRASIAKCSWHAASNRSMSAVVRSPITAMRNMSAASGPCPA